MELRNIILMISLLPGVLGNTQTSMVKGFEKLYKERASHTSMVCDVDFYEKRFSMDDTLDFHAKTKFVRDVKDTLLGGLVYLDLDSIWLGYDQDKLMKFDTRTRILWYDNASTHPGLFIPGTNYVNLVDDGFLRNSKGLKQLYMDEAIKKKISDTIVDGYPCIAMTFKVPDGEIYNNETYFAVIDTVNTCLRIKMYSVYFQGNEHYRFWRYSNVFYGNESIIPELNINSIPDVQKKEVYSNEEPDNSIQVDFEYSQLKGTLFPSGDNIDLKDKVAQFTILDFWYSSCYPCIKSIPGVVKIANEFGPKGVPIYGVNTIDNAIKGKARLDKFFLHNPMPYQTIMIDPDLRNNVPVNAFPTFLILDDHYQVVFKEDVYNPNLYDEVSAFLDKRLRAKD